MSHDRSEVAECFVLFSADGMSPMNAALLG